MIERILYNGKGNNGFFIGAGAFNYSYYGHATAVISKIVVSHVYPNPGSEVTPGDSIPTDPYNYAVMFSLGDNSDYSSTLFHRALLSTKSAQNPEWNARNGADSRVEFGKGIILQRDLNTGEYNYGLYWNRDGFADVAFDYNVTIFGTYILE